MIDVVVEVGVNVIVVGSSVFGSDDWMKAIDVFREGV